MFIIKIYSFFNYCKNIFTEIINNTRAECTIPVEIIETIARCVLPDIVKYYEENNSAKNNSEIIAYLTKTAV